MWLHEHGQVAGFISILVMDVWEHGYFLDYQPSERASSIEAFSPISIGRQWRSGCSFAGG
jgi:superoxide dismutase